MKRREINAKVREEITFCPRKSTVSYNTYCRKSNFFKEGGVKFQIVQGPLLGTDVVNRGGHWFTVLADAYNAMHTV